MKKRQWKLNPRPWIYGNELMEGYVSVWGGAGGTAKTACSFVVAAAIACGKELFDGYKVHQQANVWLYNLEDDIEEMERRIYAVHKHYGLGHPINNNHMFMNSGRDRDLIICRRDKDGNMFPTPDVERLTEVLLKNDIKLLVVDPLIHSYIGDENANQDLNLVMKQWSKVAHDASCAVLLIHHFRKGGEAGDYEAFRGASALQGAARMMRTLSVITVEDAKALGIEADKRRFYIRFADAKNNMAPPTGEGQFFKLIGVNLDNATPEYPQGDFVQTLEVFKRGDLFTATQLRDILDLVADGMPDGERYCGARQAKRWLGHAISKLLGCEAARSALIVEELTNRGLVADGTYMSAKRRTEQPCLELTEAGQQI